MSTSKVLIFFINNWEIWNLYNTGFRIQRFHE